MRGTLSKSAVLVRPAQRVAKKNFNGRNYLEMTRPFAERIDRKIVRPGQQKSHAKLPGFFRWPAMANPIAPSAIFNSSQHS